MYTYTLYTTFSRRIEESSASIKSLKQSLYITTEMKLFVNHCASTFHKMYIRFHRSRAQGVTTIELSKTRIRSQPLRGRVAARPASILVCGKVRTLKPQMLSFLVNTNLPGRFEPSDCFTMCSFNVPHVGVETAP